MEEPKVYDEDSNSDFDIISSSDIPKEIKCCVDNIRASCLLPVLNMTQEDQTKTDLINVYNFLLNKFPTPIVSHESKKLCSAMYKVIKECERKHKLVSCCSYVSSGNILWKKYTSVDQAVKHIENYLMDCDLF